MRNPLKRPGGQAPSPPDGGRPLGPDGGRPLTLVVGSVADSVVAAVPAPAADPHPAPPPAAPPARSDPALLAERRERHAELRARQALSRADEAEAAVREAGTRLERLADELTAVQREREQLRTDLEQAERRRRVADQLAHSEAVMRLELERDHGARSRRYEADAGAVLELLQAVQTRTRAIARDVEALRRASEEIVEPGGDGSDSAGLSQDPPPPVVGSAAARHGGPTPGRRARVLAAEVAIARSMVTRGLGAPPPVVAPVAPPVVAPAPLAPSAGGVADAAVAPTADVVTPERLAAARARLRAEPPRASRWLAPALKRLVRENPALAGPVLLALLPAQTLVPGAVCYDLEPGDAGCVAVAVPDGAIGFRFTGDLAGLVRLLVASRVWRRLSRRLAGVRGDRGALDALAAWIREPLTLRELDRAGVRLEPEATLQLVACMIDPSWTEGRRFALGHEAIDVPGRAYLLVRSGAAPRTSRRPPLGAVASTIQCPGEHLVAFLSGGSAPEVTVLGDPEPVALVREWIARAESIPAER